MKNIPVTTKAGIAICLLAIVWVTWMVACHQEPQPPIDYVQQTKSETDSILIAAAPVVDSAKLQAIHAFKYRIAKARFLDSLQRAKNK